MIMDTPIHFLSPNPEQKEALDELEKLLEVLERKQAEDWKEIQGLLKASLEHC